MPEPTTAKYSNPGRLFTVMSCQRKNARDPKALASRIRVCIRLTPLGSRGENFRCVSLAAMLGWLVIPAFGQTFDPGCKIRFESIAQQHPIDSSCAKEGDSALGPMRLQNAMKNNFCAPDPAVALGFSDFAALQERAAQKQIPFGSSKLPPSRAPLQHLLDVESRKEIGEGSFVRLAAFIEGAHISDIARGESANCHIPGEENNDIHVNLVENPHDDLCKSVTAEISPHLRPLQWTQLVEMGITRPVRMSGQLFFDASHRPCVEGRRIGPHPRRLSTWEIHPVYAMDICNYTTLGQCRAEDERAWTPLEAWKNETTSPTKLGLAISPSIARPHMDIKILISLLNSTNQPTAWKQDTPVSVSIESSTLGFQDRRNVTIVSGQPSSMLVVQLPNPGIYSITALASQLRSSSVFLNVLGPNRPLARLGLPTLVDVAWRSPSARLLGAPLLVAMAQDHQQVKILISPSREVMADGFDAATVSALIIGDAAHDQISINLHSSLGVFDCSSLGETRFCPDFDLVITKGTPGASARLTSTRMGDANIDAVPASPNVDLSNSSLTLHFGPPITKIAAEASPPVITLVDSSSLMVRLTDDSGKSYVPSHPKKIYISINKGQGRLQSEDNSISVTPPNHSGSASFIPGFTIGETELTARTDELPSASLRVTVKAPVWLLLISILGGITGGTVFVMMNQKSSRWRIAIGAVTGFILYWAVVFGVIATKTSFFIVNPLSDFAISVIGGWFGTQVFSLILEQFGVVAQANDHH